MNEQQRRDWRRQWMALMLSITFCGGALFGLLVGASSLPPVCVAPVLVGVSGLLFLFMLGRR